MKKNRKKQKGFSLIELIVVIAVMAVLVVVLAPAYLRYVDKAKLQKDVSAIGEVVEAIKIAAAEEDVAKEITIPDIGSSVAEAFGYNAFAQVVIANGTGNITVTKLTQGIQLNEDYLKQLKDLIENFGQPGSSLPREAAPNLQRELTEIVGTSIEFEREELRKLDVILTVSRDADYKIYVTVNATSFKNYEDVEEALKVFGVSSDKYNEAKCAHDWNTSKDISVCKKCNEKCEHSSWKDGKCTTCGKVCVHEWSNGKCTALCEMECEHKDAAYTQLSADQHTLDCGTCDIQGPENHSFANGVCSMCNYECEHKDAEGNDLNKYTYAMLHSHYVECARCNKNLDEGGAWPTQGCTYSTTNYACTKCKEPCSHSFGGDTICDKCTLECKSHDFTYSFSDDTTGHTGTCSICGYEQWSSHDYTNKDGKCKICPATCNHKTGKYSTVVWGTCTNCRKSGL